MIEERQHVARMYNTPFKRFQVPPYPVVQKVLYAAGVSEAIIPYTPAMRRLYGDFPLIQVYIEDEGAYRQTLADIMPDFPPPNTTQFTIRLAGPINFFVVVGGGSITSSNVQIVSNITTTNQETIFFTNESAVEILYTSERRNKFGGFPTIQVWMQDEGTYKITNADIEPDALPPNQTKFTVRLAGPINFFVTLK